MVRQKGTSGNFLKVGCHVETEIILVNFQLHAHETLRVKKSKDIIVFVGK